MKRLAAICTIALVGTVLAAPADAATITITPGMAECTDNDSSNDDTEVKLETCANSALSLLYKSDFGQGNANGSDSGSFAGVYDTTFSPLTEDGPFNALIEYQSGTAIACPSCWLVVKDGNATPSVYFISLNDVGAGGTAWNGTDILNIQGFWENTQGAISYVGIYGGSGTTTPGGGTTPGGQELPEPASLLLLAGSFGAAAYTARRRKARD